MLKRSENIKPSNITSNSNAITISGSIQNFDWSSVGYNSSTGKDDIADDVTIETNGNLTFDNATAQRAQYSIRFDRKDSQGNIVCLYHIFF